MSAKKKQVYWIGFDLGGTKMQATVFDGNLNIVAAKRKKTKGHEGAEAGLIRIIRTIHGALQESGVDPSLLAGIGVGSPGPLDLEKGVIIDTPNLGWKNVPLKATLEKEFGCPAVIANDVDAGLYGEYRRGAAKGARCAIGVFPGTGIGGACVYEGKLIRGRKSSCMEIGHIQVLPGGPLCGCGQRGCLEAVASRLAISSAAAAAAYRGDAPHLLEETGMNLPDIRSGSLAASVANGDAVIERIIRDAAGWLGIGIASVVNLLAPDIVVLGGGLVEALPKIYIEEVGAAVRARVMPSFQKSFKVVAAKLGDDAAVTGAAALACDMVSDKG